jgi:hypothetical protein
MERLISRYIFDPEITSGKMIFLIGPRQAGKTTFAENWLKSSGSDLYFNFDDPWIFREYKKNPLFFKNRIDETFKGTPVSIVFDEIHKQRGWRNILKGLYDVNKNKMNLLVTGSARLDHFRRAGDSLAGRYFSYHLFPLSLAEAAEDFSYILDDPNTIKDGSRMLAAARNVKSKVMREALENMLKLGGFPEPFIRGSDRFHLRWQREYVARLTREDVRDLSRVSDLKGIGHMAELIPERIGSPLSINSISEDLGVNFRTAANWIEILKTIFLIFEVRPWHNRSSVALRKARKIYFYDWTLVPDPGARFENLMAVALCSLKTRWTETGLGDFDIYYIRERGGAKEIDFVLTEKKKPVALFEAKTGRAEITAAGRIYAEKLKVPFYQVVLDHESPTEYPGNCFVIPAAEFLMMV